MIKLIDICKTYNPHTVNETKLFENFNLNINPGDFVSVIGSNGSGKTTMLNLICGSIIRLSRPVVTGNLADSAPGLRAVLKKRQK